jgi:hypothetical protein
MRTTLSDSALTLQSLGFLELKIALVEPALVVSAIFFWIAALPFVVLSLRCVEIWDTLMALTPVAGVRSNPLILDHRVGEERPATRSSTQTKQS